MTSAENPLQDTGERPLVTFVMLTWNQEAYVAEALHAALAQTYQPLEIIVSDDGSSDRTVAIVEEIAGSYSGPHRLILNRHTPGLGILRHFYDAAALGSGRLVLAAAGDDLSYPDRVATIVEQWRQTGADALYSNWDVIGPDGELIQQGRQQGRPDIRFDAYFPDQQVTQITGATEAYSAEVFRAISCPDAVIHPEDFFFTLMLALRRRKIAYIDRSLVAYRLHGGALTNSSDAELDTAGDEARAARGAALLLPALRAFERAASEGLGFDHSWGEPARVDLDAVRGDIALMEYRTRWTSAAFRERFQMLVRFRSTPHRKWLFPRTFGLRALTAVKSARRRLRGGS